MRASPFLFRDPPGDPAADLVLPAGLSKAGLIAAFRTGFGLCDLHAANWDALEEALSVRIAEAKSPLTLVHNDVPPLGERESAAYLDLLADRVREGGGKFVVTFPQGVEDAVTRLSESHERLGKSRYGLSYAVLHPHLNRGGVTRVIGNQIAVRGPRAAPTAVLHGGRAEAWPEVAADVADAGVPADAVRLHEVAGLDYDDGLPLDPPGLADRIECAVRAAGGEAGRTVLHAHNHSLGKNLSLPGAIRELADRGWRWLLQIHDFAEDFRPLNHRRLRAAFGDRLGDTLYPRGAAFHYAVLNRRDADVLTAAGVPADRLHVLPNPVGPPPPEADRHAARAALAERFDVPIDRPFLLDPVRGIRRKNLGEVILAALRAGGTAGVTLVPRNPAELAFHDRWRAFASADSFPVRFGLGEEEGLSLAENLAAADAVLTASVAEGFGMAFLEPWVAGRPLVGRDLPAVTADFRDEGLDLSGLYDRLTVPLDWIGAKKFAAVCTAAADALLNSYGVEPRPWEVDRVIAAKTAGGRVDFADLDEPLQEAVLLRIAGDPAALDDVRPEPPVPALPTGDRTAANAAVVRESYGPAACGTRLEAVYAAVRDGTGPATDGAADADIVLRELLDLGRFRLIRGVAP